MIFPSSGYLTRSSFIIIAGTAKPTIHPIGNASPPRAVASPLSWSPNHVVANLLDELIKKTWPNEATIVPIVAIGKLPVRETIYLSQAPARVIPAPVMT